jgi:acyl-CoA thioester hydrolase
VLVERRFSDLDVLGHVNNVTYAVYMEEARYRLLDQAVRRGVSIPSQVVARQELDYLRPLTLKPEPVEVLAWVESVGRTSYVIDYEMRDDDGTPAARGRTVMVCFDAAKQRKAPMPEAYRAILESAAAGEGTAPWVPA